MALAMMSLDHVSIPKVPRNEQGKYRSGVPEGRWTHGWPTAHTTDSPTGEEFGGWVTKLVNTHHEAGWWQEGSGSRLKDAPERPLSLRTPPPTVSKWQRQRAQFL